jgi:Pentatricopeptide repeat domain
MKTRRRFQRALPRRSLLLLLLLLIRPSNALLVPTRSFFARLPVALEHRTTTRWRLPRAKNWPSQRAWSLLLSSAAAPSTFEELDSAPENARAFANSELEEEDEGDDDEHDDDDDEDHDDNDDEVSYGFEEEWEESQWDGDEGSEDWERRRLASFRSDLRNLADDEPRRAQDALEIMRHMHLNETHVGATVLPDVGCYHVVMEGWIDAGAPQQAELLLMDMEHIFPFSSSTSGSGSGNMSSILGSGASTSETQPLSPAPTSSSSLLTPYTYLLVAQAWSNDDGAQETGAVRAEAILRRLQRMFDNKMHLEDCNTIRPSGGNAAAIEQQEENASDTTAARSRHLDPSVVQLWSVVLDAWCKRAGLVPDAMHRARALLLEMEEGTNPRPASQSSASIVSRHPLTPLPNVLVYTVFLGGLARSKERDLARQAEDVLERMRNHGVQPDMVAYTSVLNCWSKAVSRREREMAASRSLHLLEDMERRYVRLEEYHVKPSLVTYATAIRAIGRSLDPQAATLAEAILDRMYHLHRTGLIANLKPNTQTYNALLHALSMSPGSESQKLKYARRAEEILMKMRRLSGAAISPQDEASDDDDNLDSERRSGGQERDVEPDVRSWAAVLRAWAQCSWEAADNCQRILDVLRDLRESGETSVRPNFVCYTTVMGAWGNSKRKDGLERMEALLKYMEVEYEKTLEADVRPNTVSYVTAIDAFIRRNEPDAARRAQATVDRMLRLYAKGLGHVRPTRIIFNCLIHAYSKSKEKGAPQNAEKIFKWMETQSRIDEQVRPDGTSLCGVLNAWANLGSTEGAERALQIWNRMESVPSQERGFELSITMPNIAIKAIARTRDPDAVDKVERILLKLEDDYQTGTSRLRPDVTTASSVINAAAYYAGLPDGRPRALEIALRTFNKITDWGQEPNNITFGTLLKAVANLLSPGDPQRDISARNLFDQCCDLGYVDGFVLSQVRHASPQLYRELVDEPCGLGGPNSDTSVSSLLKNIPSEWSANVID